MKRILIIAIMLVAGAAAHCQAVYQYPYSGYMEIPIPPLGACQVGRYPGRVSPYIVWKRASPVASLRPFLVDTPTVIYGIAILLWGQDTAKRDLSAQLYTINKHLERMTLMTLQRDVRWNDSIPYRNMMFVGRAVTKTGCDGDLYFDTVKAYEFYFDTPFIATDTFFVGFQTYGVDGQAHHNYLGQDPDITGYVYLVNVQDICNSHIPYPFNEIYVLFNDRTNQTDLLRPSRAWIGMVPIIEQPPCNPDTLTCERVPDFGVYPIDSQQVEFGWYGLPSQQRFQISVGPADRSPDDNPLYDADTTPYVLNYDWDTTVLYAAYIRAQCSRHCHPAPFDTLVWGGWSEPVYFFGNRQPEGITTAQDGLFSMTPNPAKESVTVTLGTPSHCSCTIVLHDATGHSVFSTPFTGQSITIDTRGLAAGTYFLTLATPEATATRKLVVEGR